MQHNLNANPKLYRVSQNEQSKDSEEIKINNMRIGIIIGRIGGVDGVALETV